MSASTLPLLSLSDCTIEVLAYQDDCPVRGNASAFDDETDRACEDEIIDRLNRGDVWAWASVEVRLSFRDLSASDYLGCCSYYSEADFRASSGYFDDMCATALDDLNAQIAADQSGEH